VKPWRNPLKPIEHQPAAEQRTVVATGEALAQPVEADRASTRRAAADEAARVEQHRSSSHRSIQDNSMFAIESDRPV